MRDGLLDPTNKEKYSAKVKEWQDINKDFVDKNSDILRRDYKREDSHGIKEQWLKTVEKSGIISLEQESDLGAMKQKLRADERVSEDYYDVIKNRFSHGSENAKKVFTKYVPKDSVADASYEGVAQFDKKSKKIRMHYQSDSVNERGAGATWFHEHGHLIDDAAGNISLDKKFRELLDDDTYRFRCAYAEKYKIKSWDDINIAISSELSDMRKHSGVSDILGGITNGKIKGCAGHSPEYWLEEPNIASEAFAHMFEAQFDEVRYKEMQKYFPETLKYFEEMLVKIL